MDDNVLNNLKSESRWLRLLFMALYLVVGYFATIIAIMIGLVQAVIGFVAGESNERLSLFTGSLNLYLYQILQFITYNSDTKPFPFSDWPDSKQSSTDSGPSGE